MRTDELPTVAEVSNGMFLAVDTGTDVAKVTWQALKEAIASGEE